MALTYGEKRSEPRRHNLKLSGLKKAVEASYRALEPFRNLNRNLIEEYAGPSYGNNSSIAKEKYVNKLNQAVDAYTMMLAANRPRVDIVTEVEGLVPFATHYTATMNNFLREIKLEQTLQRAVLDAFFCIGIVKIHLADSLEVMIEDDLWMDPGQPFASNLSIDNMVMDMGAQKHSEVKFIGDQYRIPFSDLEYGVEIGMYDKKVASDLVPNTKYQLDEERVERISKGYEVDFDEYEPMIDLCDIWVKRDGKIYTFPLSKRNQFTIGEKPLAAMEWDHPEAPPYEFLKFADVPENVMPVSPAAHLAALDRLINNMLRKQARKARRTKELQLFTMADKAGAARIQSASDGDMIPLNNVEEHASITIGGVDPNLQAMTASALDLLDQQAGNITALLGLGPQSRTVGQDQMIQSASNRKIGQMQNRVVEFSTSVIRSLGFLLWKDEFKEVVNQIPVDDEGLTMTTRWVPGDRAGNFWDYNFEINLYSMTYQPPAQQIETLNALLGNIYLPSMQILESQGGTINFQALNEVYSDLLNMPKLKEIIQFGGAPIESKEAKADISGNPNTTRNYVRQHMPSQPDAQQEAAQQMVRPE